MVERPFLPRTTGVISKSSSRTRNAMKTDAKMFFCFFKPTVLFFAAILKLISPAPRMEYIAHMTWMFRVDSNRHTCGQIFVGSISVGSSVGKRLRGARNGQAM